MTTKYQRQKLGICNQELKSRVKELHARNKELDQIRESHESHIEIMLEKDHSNEVSQKEIEELKSKLADQEKKAK